jgi:hypothetical protein
MGSRQVAIDEEQQVRGVHRPALLNVTKLYFLKLVLRGLLMDGGADEPATTRQVNIVSVLGSRWAAGRWPVTKKSRWVNGQMQRAQLLLLPIYNATVVC